ncbi:MAG: hypothetical protein P9L90_06935 [Candidatus Aadella gelida]|nr:hypothetical protein [Candidatus Aadella gelida]
MRKLYIFGLIGLAGIVAAAAFAEDITITTYYPAPFGVYNEMRANKLIIGDPNSASTPAPDTDGVVIFKDINNSALGGNDAQKGALYYDSSAGFDEFKYHDGTGWQALCVSGGCYVSYSGGCLAGFTNKGSAGLWGYCYDASYQSNHFRPPSGGCTVGTSTRNLGVALVCCQ